VTDRATPTVLITALTAAALIAPAGAQQDGEIVPTEQAAPQSEPQQQQRGEHWLDRIQFSLHGGGEYQFETDTGSTGEFSVIRAGVGITGRSNIKDDVNLSFRLDYGLDSYDFSNTMPGFGTDEPWDDIHTFSAGAVLRVDVADDWSLFGGPIFQFSGESGADFGDSIVGGGLIGGTYRVSDSLTIGGGVGVVSQIEEDVRLFPVFAINWEITNDWALRNTSHSGAGQRGGLELVYSPDDRWEAALGGGYHFKRFRLDANDGVGEDNAIPIWGRFTYRVTDNVRVNLFGGLMFDGELTLEDSSGNEIAEEDYDTAGVIGVSGVIRF